ncbi:MAG: hypothetical protein ACRDPC_26685 [Solirubrobacteraceae bacterium]
MRLSSIALAGAVVAAAALPAPALAQDPGTAQAANARVTVQLDIMRFRATQRGPEAVAKARAQLRGLGGMPTTVTKKVRLSVQRGGRCRILRLVLEELDLTLLGLNVHLDRVDLRVTGERRGGILGRLFCSLANSRVRGAQAKAVASLNERLREGGRLRPLRMTVPVQAVAAQQPVCEVLELILGPLDLNLLGLVVELNRVHLTITAIPGGGVLGDLFCGLTGPPTT